MPFALSQSKCGVFRGSLKIIRAILSGERDGQAPAKLKNGRIRASAADIAKSLQGNWREEHLFALKQAVALQVRQAFRLVAGPVPGGAKISGGKALSAATKPVANRASKALRKAAASLRSSQSALGTDYRRLCARMGLVPAPSPPAATSWPG